MNCKPKYNNKENLNVEEHINSITNAQTLVARAVDYENKKLVYGEDALSIVTKKLPEFKNLAEQNAVMDNIARLFLNSIDDILLDKKLTDPLAGLNFNLKDLNKNFKDGDMINPKTLFNKGLIDDIKTKIKILGMGELDLKNIIVDDLKMSAKVKIQIEKNGAKIIFKKSKIKN